ncbi:MAG TPA: MarR family transcriptional regulator [Acidimicrobiia bacterium]|nr:MarR family transcriptional regulator [Acidimicrobiia bacterium]
MAGRIGQPDLIVEAGPHTFVIEFKRSGAAGSVAGAIEQAKRHAAAVGKRAIPLVVVPFMGESGKRKCEEAHVAWMDLSGNAQIFVPGLRVLVEGKPNRFKLRGRPSSVFAPKSSRIARWLLMHPAQAIAQRELAVAAGVDEGFTSRIVSRLEEDNLVVRETSGAIRPRNPGVLLDAWREVYDFGKHVILHGHVAARSGDELLRRLASTLRDRGVDHAATGLGAAWLYTRFGGFRIVTFYLRDEPPPALLQALSFREESRGANTWIVTPNDDGVFQDARHLDGVRCVHPIQTYLDLKGHPERASEAAAQVRLKIFDDSADA